MIFSAYVRGDPKPKGSKDCFPHPVTGRMVVKESSGVWLEAWRSALSLQLPRGRPPDPLGMPVGVAITFYLRRPKKASKLDFPTRKSVDGDIDKLVRAVLDELVKARWIVDDSLVVDLHAYKRWGSAGSASITVSPVEVEDLATA